MANRILTNLIAHWDINNRFHGCKMKHDLKDSHKKLNIYINIFEGGQESEQHAAGEERGLDLWLRVPVLRRGRDHGGGGGPGGGGRRRGPGGDPVPQTRFRSQHDHRGRYR